MRAIILAAGLGTRMRPLTDSMPKPLVPVVGKPLIDWCLDWLQDAGIGQVVINSSYRAAQLEDYLASRATPALSFSREEPEPLETGGGIAKALQLLGEEPFLAMNSDAIFAPCAPHPVAQLQAAWTDDLDFLMLLVPVSAAIGLTGNGDFVVDDAGRIRRPHAGEAAGYVFSGVEIIHPRVFAGCPAGAFSLNRFWRERAGADGWHRHMRAVICQTDWLNVGDIPGLQAAEAYLQR